MRTFEKYIVTIASDLAGNSAFTKEIYCPFVPDTVIVKNAMYNNDGTEVGVSGLRSNLIRNEILCYLCDSTYCHKEIEYDLYHEVRGLYLFECVDQTGSLEARAGDIFVTLEFRKYN